MSYKIKNGIVWIRHNNAWYLDSVLFALWPDLKTKQLKKVGV